jgi:hypothetical protein
LENRASGVTYTQIFGCNVMMPKENTTWEALCLQYPNVAPFRNSGWEIYKEVKKLCPNKAKGTHSFYPSNGTQGVCDPTSSANFEALQGSETLHRFSPEWAEYDDPALNATLQQSAPDEEALSNSVGTEAVCYLPILLLFVADTSFMGSQDILLASVLSPEPAKTPKLTSRKRKDTSTPPSIPAKRVMHEAEALAYVGDSVLDFGWCFESSTEKLIGAMTPAYDASPIQ